MLRTTVNVLQFARKGPIESVTRLENCIVPSHSLAGVGVASINDVRSTKFVSCIFCCLSLTDCCDSPMALGSKVGPPSSPYLVSLVKVSLERSPMFLTNLLRTGFEKEVCGTKAPGVSLSTYAQCVSLSFHWCYSWTLNGASKFTKVKVAGSSMKPNIRKSSINLIGVFLGKI